jgi:chromosome segregation ATPase
LRKRYESKLTTLENRLQRARQRVESQQEMANQSKIDTAIGVGTALLGAFLGRKRVTQTTASSVGSAIRKAGRMSKKAGDVSRASELVETVEQEIEDLNRAFESEVEQLDALHDVGDESLEEVLVRAASTSIQVQAFGLAWLPVIRDDDGRGRIALASGSRSSPRRG